VQIWGQICLDRLPNLTTIFGGPIYHHVPLWLGRTETSSPSYTYVGRYEIASETVEDLKEDVQHHNRVRAQVMGCRRYWDSSPQGNTATDLSKLFLTIILQCSKLLKGAESKFATKTAMALKNNDPLADDVSIQLQHSETLIVILGGFTFVQ